MRRDKGKITVADEVLDAGFAQLPRLLLRYSDISLGAKVAYAMLLWYHYSQRSYPGHTQMADDCNTSERSIRRHRRELVDARLVEVTQPGLGETNSYHLPRLADRLDLSSRPEMAGLVGQTRPSSKDNRSVKNLQTNTKDPSLSSQPTPDDKTALIATIISEFAPTESMQAIQTYLGRFPASLITRAAEITRANSHATNPIAYLYGVIQRLQEQEATQPAAHQHIEVAPELTEEEYQASLQALERVKAQLSQ